MIILLEVNIHFPGGSDGSERLFISVISILPNFPAAVWLW